jgi:hypothetical protein
VSRRREGQLSQPHCEGSPAHLNQQRFIVFLLHLDHHKAKRKSSIAQIQLMANLTKDQDGRSCHSQSRGNLGLSPAVDSSLWLTQHAGWRGRRKRARGVLGRGGACELQQRQSRPWAHSRGRHPDFLPEARPRGHFAVLVGSTLLARESASQRAMVPAAFPLGGGGRLDGAGERGPSFACACFSFMLRIRPRSFLVFWRPARFISL